ncbi:hypothetical protein OCHUTO_0785 [Orientia chuto str. Dubai]|uniref:Nucleotidyltransferase domain protein n=1 Tax=Orientia chuto str. Dubai TaxID=1359168 RepID=A0A0F3MII6_9RICK|nr:hypothetical protein [Candidatus Orientia mediorientalis]KJV55563.1 hypothetical protein OCHUTO_0785 [Orientia chuto str. Dubai]
MKAEYRNLSKLSLSIYSKTLLDTSRFITRAIFLGSNRSQTFLKNLERSIFLLAQEDLEQGLGSKAILEFLKLHGNQYSYILADPDINNLSAIKCYEKAGFKMISEQEDTGEVWMLKDLSLRHNPLPTIKKLIKERYIDAEAIFWAGSVAANQGTNASDLDLVIVYESLPHAYREAFVYDGWPIDSFIHDLDILRYFCGKLEASDGKPALINMIIQGKEILAQNSVSIEAKVIAGSALAKGPDSWTQAQIDKERFLITDILDDIKSPKNKEKQIISAVHLFEPLLQLYFRAQKKWTASGKSLIRLLKQENPELAEEWTAAFESLVQTGDTFSIESAVTKILAAHGGYLWMVLGLMCQRSGKNSMKTKFSMNLNQESQYSSS